MHHLAIAAIVGVGLGTLGYGLMRRAKLKKQAAADADARSIALKKATAIGCADGKVDGVEDAHKIHNPRPVLNHSDLKDIQQQYENSYNGCYEEVWIAPTSTPDVIKDSTPTAGGSKGMTACAYGTSRGRSAGLKAADDGIGGSEAASMFKANLETDGSKKRQAESGNAAEYRRCYLNGATSAYASRLALEAVSEILPTSDSTTSGLSRASLSTPTTVGRIGRGLGFWQGGRKVTAVSGARERYSSTVAAEQAISTGGM